MIKNPFKKDKVDSEPGVTFFFERYGTTLKLIRQDWFECDILWDKTVEEIRKALGAIIKSETKVTNEVCYNEFGQYNGQAKMITALCEEINNEINEIIKDHPHSDIVWQNGGKYEVRHRNSPENVQAFVLGAGGAGGAVTCNKDFEHWTKKQLNKNIHKKCRDRAEIIAGLLMNSENVLISGEVEECGYAAIGHVTYGDGIDYYNLRISKNGETLSSRIPYIKGTNLTEIIRKELIECIYQIELEQLNVYKDRYDPCNTLDEYVDRILEDHGY